MEKTYCEYFEEISPDELYEGLLGYGMFAPIFTSASFFDYCRANNPIYQPHF